MKITNRQFSIVKTLMAQLHLLRQLGMQVYWALQNTIFVSCSYAKLMLTEVKGKKNEKSQTETRL